MTTRHEGTNGTPAEVALPTSTGEPETYRLNEPRVWQRPAQPLRSRVAYAAAHVVPDPLADNTPGGGVRLDWDETLGYRHEIWSYGLGVAEAMDTAQRGMGLDWATTRELIARSGAEARSVAGMLACGAGTDQLDPAKVGEGPAALQRIIDAYLEQMEVVTEAGATVILMASRALARAARTAEDYRTVYDAVLRQAPGRVIVHWLGPMFDPALAGYWGDAEVPIATKTFLEMLHDHTDRVDGVKVSLLDAEHETALRRELPVGMRLYTGDDFNYPDLILGDGQHHSDALLGIFAAVYPAASAALQALDAGDDDAAREILDSTQALGRHIFSAPTPYYKTGIAFLSWLNGRQSGFSMVGGLHSGRSLPHLVEVFRLADRAELLVDPALAAHRMRQLLSVHGWQEIR